MSDHTDLAGQTVVVLGGTAGMGLSTARAARAHGAEVIVVARNAERLKAVAEELGGGTRTASFDVTDLDAVSGFFGDLAQPVDHVLVTGPGPYYAELKDFDFDAAARDLRSHVLLPIQVARCVVGRVRQGGTLLFVGGTGGRHVAPGLALIGALTAAMPALVKDLALEIAPVRVNLIAAGFVDTPLSASLLGDDLDARRQQLRDTLPIRRVVGPDDIAELAIHLMRNTAMTGATYDIDGGQQLVEQ
jgi:NAD(P)-dependent dehydrogenase (short-subunit alcohol dehydrogenase family)